MNPALDELFPPSTGVEIISEPGRFFTASAFTLTTNVIAKRRVDTEGSAINPSFMYYVNDGVYGSFNCLLYDHAEVQPSIPCKSITVFTLFLQCYKSQSILFMFIPMACLLSFVCFYSPV